MMFGDVEVKVNVYYYDNKGCGDWILFYIVDVMDDGINGYFELVYGNMVMGGLVFG